MMAYELISAYAWQGMALSGCIIELDSSSCLIVKCIASLNIIVVWGILEKIALLNLGDVSDKRFLASLHYFMEDDPVRLSILETAR